MLSVLLQHRIQAEGEMGRVYAAVTWSDGAIFDVGLASAFEDGLAVTSPNPNVRVRAPAESGQ